MKVSIALTFLILLIGCTNNSIIIDNTNTIEQTGKVETDVMRIVESNIDTLSGWIEVTADIERLRKDRDIDLLETRSDRTMIDYLIGLSDKNLLLRCDVTSLFERDRENRKKLLEIYDEENGYISLDSSIPHYNEGERDPGPTYLPNQQLSQNGKEYISQELQQWIYSSGYAKYWREDYNFEPLYQIVRYYNKQKEAIIVINSQGGGPMCSRLSFLKEDPLTHDIISVENEVRSDIICKDTEISLSSDENNFIMSNTSNIDIYNGLWVFPQKGTKVIHINNSREVDGYVIRNGSKFGCTEGIEN